MNSLIKKYYRLTKPGIIYGNLLATAGGFFLASRGSVDFLLLLATLSGTGLVIGSGCVFNNYLDRNIDRQMSRTQNRALANGSISAVNALTFATLLFLAGFIILGFFTNILTLLIGVIGFVFYVIVYGIAKRNTKYGTLVGGVSGSTPLVAGYTAVTNSFDTGALLLFLIMFFWQMPHFYAISIFRLKEYRAAGLPLWSIKEGIENTKLHMIFFTALFLLSVIQLTLKGYTGYSYLAVMSVLGVYWLYKGVSGFKDKDSVKWARGMFGYSLIVLLVFSVIISIDNWLP